MGKEDVKDLGKMDSNDEHIEENENNKRIHDKRDILKRDEDKKDDGKEGKKEFNHLQYSMDMDKQIADKEGRGVKGKNDVKLKGE